MNDSSRLTQSQAHALSGVDFLDQLARQTLDSSFAAGKPIDQARAGLDARATRNLVEAHHQIHHSAPSGKGHCRPRRSRLSRAIESQPRFSAPTRGTLPPTLSHLMEPSRANDVAHAVVFLPQVSQSEDRGRDKFETHLR